MKACTQTVGRRYPEEGGLSDPFLEDFCRINETAAKRSLAHKTQAFPILRYPHARTRGIHTDEVVASSGRVSEALGLNIHLTMAIGNGHDVGHIPYGHHGERILTELAGRPFRHSVNGVFILQHIENEGRGINPTYEVGYGIHNHSRGDGELYTNPGPQESNVVMLVDKIDYTFTDFEDAISYGQLKKEDIPRLALSIDEFTKEDIRKFLRDIEKSPAERKKECIKALIEESREAGKVQFTKGPAYEDFINQKKFNYPIIYSRVDSGFHEYVLKKMFDVYSKYPELAGVDIPFFISLHNEIETNKFGLLISELDEPPKEEVMRYGAFKVLPYISGKNLDNYDPDLAWGEELMAAGQAKTP
jgi:dGTP triphosphohydrolase